MDYRAINYHRVIWNNGSYYIFYGWCSRPFYRNIYNYGFVLCWRIRGFIKMRILHVKVAGVSFEGRQEHLARLNGREPVRLVPEPKNPYDANAIGVHIAVDGK